MWMDRVESSDRRPVAVRFLKFDIFVVLFEDFDLAAARGKGVLFDRERNSQVGNENELGDIRG
jgi:hypothetical protein